MWWDGGNVMGKIEVLDTPSGKTLKQLVTANVKLGISSRGLGSVKEKDGLTIVEDDFQLICFDIVSEPSTPGAYLSPDKVRPAPRNLDTGNLAAYINESGTTKSSTLNNLFEMILRDKNETK